MSLPTCPFCEGDAHECFTVQPVQDVGQSWMGGYVEAWVECGKCRARCRKYISEAKPCTPTPADVDVALEHARIIWSPRLRNTKAERLEEALRDLVDCFSDESLVTLQFGLALRHAKHVLEDAQ